jgi:hypothetical protein
MRTLAVLLTLALATRALAADTMLFDFESPIDLKAWQPFESTILKTKDPAPKLELVTDNATAGKQSLKLTFTAAHLPGISTTTIPVTDWKPFATFHADIAAARDCLVLLRAAPKDPKPKGADAEASFIKIARLYPGKNHVEDIIGIGAYGGLSRKQPVAEFDIALLDAKDGDTLTIDNIHLSDAPLTTASPYRNKTVTATGMQPANYPPYPLPEKFTVLGREQGVKTVVELADELKDKWVEPKEVTLDEVEAAMKTDLAQIQKTDPAATLLVLRDGDNGYTGLHDAYLGAQAPAGLSYTTLGHGNGKDITVEFAFRHRCPIYQVDVSQIPAGSTIHKAQLVLTRTVAPDRKGLEGNYRSSSPFKPTFWVAEACNKPWVENETNGLQYATGKYWNEPNGMNWTGDDPDFSPTILAYGQSGLTLCTWDLTNAVKLWTDGKSLNHGFCIYPVQNYLDFGRFYTNESRDAKKRPLMMIIYTPGK